MVNLALSLKMEAIRMDKMLEKMHGQIGMVSLILGHSFYLLVFVWSFWPITYF